MCIYIRNTQRKISLNTTKIHHSTKTILHSLKLSDWNVAIWFTTNPTIRKLNNFYRKVDKPTDILSIPLYNWTPGVKVKAPPVAEKELGDLIISIPYVEKYCKVNKRTLEERLPELLVHGICHLIGYDHITDAQYKQMRRKEQFLLKQLQSDTKGKYNTS